jgi:hypothetical protein
LPLCAAATLLRAGVRHAEINDPKKSKSKKLHQRLVEHLVRVEEVQDARGIEREAIHRWVRRMAPRRQSSAGARVASTFEDHRQDAVSTAMDR